MAKSDKLNDVKELMPVEKENLKFIRIEEL